MGFELRKYNKTAASGLFRRQQELSGHRIVRSKKPNNKIHKNN